MTRKIAQLFDLSGKTAIVTGAAMGIGKGIAMRLAEAGASVVVADINLEAARTAVKEIKAAGYKAAAVQADTSRVSEAQKVVQAALETFGDLHILVNNAGIYPMSPALDMTEETWDRVLDINLKGAMFFSQAAARAMIAKGHGGKIVSTTSIDAFYPTVGNLAEYDASKGGLVSLTRALAKEWAQHCINVNAIAPGAIATPGGQAGSAGMSKEELEAATKAFIAKIPLGRMGEPDDIGRVALFLASEASDYITGTTIVADGGYLVG